MSKIKYHEVALLLANNKREFGKPFNSEIKLMNYQSKKKKLNKF